jgi:hypothetical protein
MADGVKPVCNELGISEILGMLRSRVTIIGRLTRKTEEQIASDLGLEELVVVSGTYLPYVGGTVANQWTAKTAVLYVRGNVQREETSNEYRITSMEQSFGKFIRFSDGGSNAGIEIVRLPLNDNKGYGGVWTVGARYYGKPIITLDAAMTKVEVLS